MSKIEEIEIPVLIEPSTLYCKYGRKICIYYAESYKICTLKDCHIQWERDHKTPYWCPLKMDALFPKKK